MTTALKVALHPSLAPSLPEVKYALRTLLRIAGFGFRFEWSSDSDGGDADIYYGPESWKGTARCRINWCGKLFAVAPSHEPASLHEEDGLSFLTFGEPQPGFHRDAEGRVIFRSDIVFGSYWLLTGAAEPRYRRDRVDNLNLEGSFFLRNGLLQKPLVSLYGHFLRQHFARLGREPLALPWNGKTAAFAFTHDVDYPEMLRWIEALFVMLGRRHAPRRVIPQVLRGANHFWKFSEWVEMERGLGARPAFYFSARRGSLLQYAAGTPDCFYDIQSPRFRDLFRYLRDEGCEVGLHASFHAYRSENQLRNEKVALESAAGVTVHGGRHHYWRLNPEGPHETLARHQRIGMQYDSSLGFEFYPGFRRGVCHPFHPFDTAARHELEILELPPTWMDDHFDRRLAKNGIADPDAHARGLLGSVRSTGGVGVLDYHVRGMNGDFYPRYGPWLARFIEKHLDSDLRLGTPLDLARLYLDYGSQLDAASADQALSEASAPSADFAVGRMQPSEVEELARIHHLFFGTGEMHGTSIANFGVPFLEQVFYRLNLDNPYFFVDVARYRGEIIAFSVYATDGKRVFRETLRRHFLAVVWALVKTGLRKPLTVLTHVLSNLQFLREQAPEAVRGIPAWYFLLGVKPEYRTREFKQRTGIWIGKELWQHMERTLAEHGCDQFWTVVGAHNGPMNELHRRLNMEMVATGRVQGLQSNYYRKSLRREGAPQ